MAEKIGHSVIGKHKEEEDFDPELWERAKRTVEQRNKLDDKRIKLENKKIDNEMEIAKEQLNLEKARMKSLDEDLEQKKKLQDELFALEREKVRMAASMEENEQEEIIERGTESLFGGDEPRKKKDDENIW